MAETQKLIIQPDLFLLDEDHRPFVVNKGGHIGIPFPPFSLRFAAAIGTMVFGLLMLITTLTSDESSRQDNNLLFWGVCLAFGGIYFLRLVIRYRNLRRLETEGQLIEARFIQASENRYRNRPLVSMTIEFKNPENNEIRKKLLQVDSIDRTLAVAIKKLKPQTQMVVLYRNKQDNIVL